MKDQLIHTKSGKWKSLMIIEDQLCLSFNKVSSKEKFQKALAKTGMMKSAFSIPLSDVKSIRYNSSEEKFKMSYINEQGKEKKMSILMQDKQKSIKLADSLAAELNMNKTEVEEKKTMPLLLNSIGAIGAMALAVFVAMMEDTSQLGDTSSGSRKSRSGGAIVRLLLDTVGQTGLAIIFGLVSLYMIYLLYNRYQNPAREVVFEK